MHSKSLQSCPTLQPYGPKPSRLPCTGESPGKNTGVCCHSPGDLPNPGTKPVSPASPAVAGRFFATSATWEAPFWLLLICNELHQNRQSSNNHFISLMILWVGASGRPQLGSSSLILMESAECGRVQSQTTSPLCGQGAPLTC